MPRLKNQPPKISKSGNYAYVYLNGERIRMGRWGTQEADKNYRRFLTEWAISNQAPTARLGMRVNIEEVVAGYLDWAEENIDHRDFKHTKAVVDIALPLYFGTPVDEFGPKALAVVQKELERSGRFSRGYCNKLVNRLRAIFRWGVAQEMVPASVADALKYVQPLLKGRSVAPEAPPREDVPDEIVDRTLPYLLPTVAAMVQVQRLACMRPSEVCNMKVGEIDTSGEIWLYDPPKHKGTWRGHEKTVALGRPEQDLIGPYMVGKHPDDHVFSPRDALEEKRQRDADRRKTKVQPSQAARKERKPGTVIGEKCGIPTTPHLTVVRSKEQLRLPTSYLTRNPSKHRGNLFPKAKKFRTGRPISFDMPP